MFLDNLLHFFHKKDIICFLRHMAFISPNMKIRPGRDCSDFADYIIQKCINSILSCIKSAETHLGSSVGFNGFSIAVQERIAQGCSVGVPWHVNFRDDGHMSIGSIPHQFLKIFLCKETTCTTANFLGPANLGQFGPWSYLNSPSLVIWKVEVKRIVFVIGQQVHIFFDFFHTEEMSCHVQHGPPVFKLGFIHYFSGGNKP